MSDYKKIAAIYESTGQIDAYDRGNKTSRKYLPRTDARNSTALTTSTLPGGTSQLNMAAMGTGGGISQDEEIEIKGFGKLQREEISKMFDRVLADLVKAKRANEMYVVNQKVHMLMMLNQHLGVKG